MSRRVISLSLCRFQTLVREVEEKEVSSQQWGEMPLSARWARLAPTLIFFLSLSNHHSVIFMNLMITRNTCFPTTAAAQKDRLDGAGAPRDVRQFGKGAVLLREKFLESKIKIEFPAIF